jgi:hypothetical protein
LTVLDAYAVIAYLKAEPAAGQVRPLLTGGDATLTAVGVAEVIDHLVRLVGADEENAALDLATSDPHLLDVCQAEGVPTIVLAAAGGTKWAPPS